MLSTLLLSFSLPSTQAALREPLSPVPSSNGEEPSSYQALEISEDSSELSEETPPPAGQNLLFMASEGESVERLAPLMNSLADDGHNVFLYTSDLLLESKGISADVTPLPSFLSSSSTPSKKAVASLLREPEEEELRLERTSTWSAVNEWSTLMDIVRQNGVSAIVYDVEQAGVGKYLAQAAGIRHFSSLAKEADFDAFAESFYKVAGPVRKDTSARFANFVRQQGWATARAPDSALFRSAAGIGRGMGGGDMFPLAGMPTMSPTTLFYSSAQLEGDVLKKQTNTRFLPVGRSFPDYLYNLAASFEDAAVHSEVDADILEEIGSRYGSVSSSEGGASPLVFIDFGSDSKPSVEASKLIVNALASDEIYPEFFVVFKLSSKVEVSEEEMEKIFEDLGRIPVAMAVIRGSIAPSTSYFLLSKASLYVSHATTQDMHTAMSLGVPILALPSSPRERKNVQKIEDLKIGEEAGEWRNLLLPGGKWVEEGLEWEVGRLFQEEMFLQVKEMLEKEDYLENAEKVGEELGGVGMEVVKNIILGAEDPAKFGIIDDDKYFLAALLTSLLPFLLFTSPAVVIFSK